MVIAWLQMQLSVILNQKSLDYAAVEATDDRIGEILNALKDAGIEKSTLILFTADHGRINKGHGGTTMQERQIS